MTDPTQCPAGNNVTQKEVSYEKSKTNRNYLLPQEILNFKTTRILKADLV